MYGFSFFSSFYADQGDMQPPVHIIWLTIEN